MDVDRRHLMAGMAGLAIAGCSEAKTPDDRAADSGAYPPANHTTADAEPSAAPFGPFEVNWAGFKRQFMDVDGRIVDNGNGGISHSEGQSYGLMLAAAAGDRAGFDKVLGWTEAKLARPDIALYAWRYDPRAPNPVADRNSATDGDLLIAYALAKAATRWRDPRYAARSHAIVDAIGSRIVRQVGGRMLLLPGLDGFSTPARTTINQSYYVWPALDLFARTGNATLWRRVIADGEALFAAARFGANRLPTDWIDVSNSGAVSPAADKPPRFGFDAIRVPLYASVSGRSALIEPIRSWWRTMPVERIPAWTDVVTGHVAEYPLSVGGRAVVSRTLGTPAPRGLSTDYYAAALQCLAGAFA
ncbi:glycosyl hydrolase family 8 [Sphingomonas sp. R86520]|uniref:glycosyl hydrolase family 8 n=1 Tax=Sphingomonas sp. R86520 TaxID=3093859 RepID=UPI0036D41C00